MISVSEGKSLIRQHARELNTVPVVLSDANGKVLAEDVYAAVDIPNYPQSSMDGYAFHFDDFQQHGKLIVNGEMAAEWVIAKPGFHERSTSISKRLLTDPEQTVITFEMPDATSPRGIGAGGDVRELAIAVGQFSPDQMPV